MSRPFATWKILARKTLAWKSLATATLLVGAISASAEGADWSKQLAAIREVGNKGAGHPAATAAALEMKAASASDVPQILAAMDGASPLAENWLRGLAEAAATRRAPLPKTELETFLADTKHSPHARRLSYELLASVDPSAEAKLIPTLLSDPSLELRRDAVAYALSQAAAEKEKPAQIAAYKKAFAASRDLDQIKEASAKLRDAGETVDIATHMGYLMTWKVIGPFDNIEDKGWDVAYPPELGIDPAAEYEGMKGKVKWIDHTTTDDYGVVDLNKVLENHKGAIVYCLAEFASDKDQTIDLRLGCINATKLWVNGELVSENHVYHAGMEVDQYNQSVKLKKGNNTILLKVCQNEQKEAWAQRWQFQIRACDSIGTAILSQDRPLPKTAELPRTLR